MVVVEVAGPIVVAFGNFQGDVDNYFVHSFADRNFDVTAFDDGKIVVY